MEDRRFRVLNLMILYSIEFLLLLLMITPTAKAVWIDLPSSGTKCISEEIQRNVVVLADYFVIGDAEVHSERLPTISVRVSLLFNSLGLMISLLFWKSLVRKWFLFYLNDFIILNYCWSIYLFIVLVIIDKCKKLCVRWVWYGAVLEYTNFLLWNGTLAYIVECWNFSTYLSSIGWLLVYFVLVYSNLVFSLRW